MLRTIIIMWISCTGFHPNHRINVNSSNRNLFNPLRKMWLLLRGFSRISPSLSTYSLVSVPIFFQVSWKSRKFEPMLLTSLSKVWGFHFTEFHETHIFSTAILLDLLCRISLELVKTCWKYEYKYFYASQVKYECHCDDFRGSRIWWREFYKCYVCVTVHH